MSTTTNSPVLQGRTALITGAAQGMGEAMARLFAKVGINVVLSDLKEEQGRKVAEEINAAGGNAIFVTCDVTKSDQLKALVEATVEKYGKLDIAVNNAAFPTDTNPINELDEERFERLIAVNLKGVAYGMKWESQQMIKQGPCKHSHSVSRGSVTSLRTVARGPAYTASKHAVVGLTKSGARDLGKHKIRVNAVLPGATKTAFSLEWMKNANVTEEQLAADRSLLGHIGVPEDTAQAALYLISAPYATGTLLSVDGGAASSM
ncbi:NAD(P)-binding protein [Dendrothele bispora CBS 962.96]|uniref:NAD(P)-binding protein n=1 Tax=Dendrothele bispora (strain CBS 962.96) TaxID=1314807 RepID=A0A4S8LFR6_DENBC|nr:NAD(P)-binding protein [Dendrothele bispora CBS 962.96]